MPNYNGRMSKIEREACDQALPVLIECGLIYSPKTLGAALDTLTDRQRQLLDEYLARKNGRQWNKCLST